MLKYKIMINKCAKLEEALSEQLFHMHISDILLDINLKYASEDFGTDFHSE